jgi:hypothetical protein
MQVLLQTGVVAMFKPLIDSCPSVIPVDYDQNYAAYRTLVAVADCDVTQRGLFVGCEFALATNNRARPISEWFHEFSFSIIIQSHDGADLPFVTQDRERARPYIPKEQRDLIMPIVLGSLAALLRRVKPMMIFRVTNKPVPVRKALIKHDRVTDFLFENGYSVLESGNDAFGRPFWLMAKSRN